MDVREFRKALEKLKTMYASAGAKAQATDFAKLIAALNGHDGQSIEDYVSETKSRLSIATKPKSGRAPKVDHAAAIAHYALALLDAGTDQALFSASFNQLSSDRNAVKQVVDAVANQYLNAPSGGTHSFKFKTKAHALETIRVKFIERAQSESKRTIIERMTRRS